MLLLKTVYLICELETLYIWSDNDTSWLCENEQLINFPNLLPALLALNISLACKEKAAGVGVWMIKYCL